jgi:hypothetical protein
LRAVLQNAASYLVNQRLADLPPERDSSLLHE